MANGVSGVVVWVAVVVLVEVCVTRVIEVVEVRLRNVLVAVVVDLDASVLLA